MNDSPVVSEVDSGRTAFWQEVLEDSKADLGRLGCIGKATQCPRSIVVIGCGGTGSWFVPKLIKIIADALRREKFSDMADRSFRIVLVDGDEVSAKNLIRQNFHHLDVGKNKAAVLATRYQPQEGVKINLSYIDKYIGDSSIRPIDPSLKDHYFDLAAKDDGEHLFHNGLVISLLDNGISRKVLHLSAMACKSAQVIDVGNNLHNGQLTCSCYASRFANGGDLLQSWFYKAFPEQLSMIDDVQVYSCADHDDNIEEQMLSANDMAATVLGNFLSVWVDSHKLSYGIISFTTGPSPSMECSAPFFCNELVSMAPGQQDGYMFDAYCYRKNITFEVFAAYAEIKSPMTTDYRDELLASLPPVLDSSTGDGEIGVTS